MGLPVEVNNLMLGSLGGYTVGRSLRFRSSASAYLSRTPSVTGNQKKWTWSAWVKRGSLTNGYLMTAPNNSGPNDGTVGLYFESNQLFTYYDTSGTNPAGAVGPAVFRDTSAWYHIVWAVDAVNTIHYVYVNNVLVSTDTSKYPPNYAYSMNQAGYLQTMGTQAWGIATFFDGYMAEVNFIDGQALTPSSFGAYDTNGVWQPKKYTGTYGTNGFYLPFSLSATSSYAGGFNGSSQSLSGTLASAIGSGNFTIEGWVRQNTLTNYQTWFAITRGAGGFNIGTDASGNLVFYSSSARQIDVAGVMKTNQWQHIAFVRNGTTLTAYLNGIARATATVSTNFSATSFYIGSLDNTQEFLNASMSNLRLTNTAVYTSNFIPSAAPLSAVSGTILLTLQSATVVDNSGNSTSITNTGSVTMSAATPFADPDIAADYSGNVNNWTPNNISLTAGTTYDSMIDSPTNSESSSNYAVLNPLRTPASTTISNGNLSMSDSTNNHNYLSTIGMTSGKWYFEFVASASGFSAAHAGIAISTISPDTYIGSDTNGYAYHATTGQVLYNNSSLGNYSTWTAGDVIGIAYDADGGKLYVAKNNTWQNSGNPAAGTGAVATGIASNTWFFGIGGNPSALLNVNFGQQPFTYTPPSGYKALNTYNLPDSTIKKGNKFFDTSLFTGTSGNVTISGLDFQPDFVWLKARSNAQGHTLFDSVRGVSKYLQSNLTNAEATMTNPPSFTSDGWVSTTDTHTNGYTYVGWQWKAGGTGVTNTSGTITSTVSASPSSGFSIATYTGNGTAGATVGHGLGVTPAMVIMKSRTLTGSAPTPNWLVWHQSISQALHSSSTIQLNGFTGALYLNLTNASSAYGMDAQINGSGQTYVAYCFSAVRGYSAFSSYSGNGSADGPFCYLGFRPRYVMIKRTDSANWWLIWDSSRNTYNVLSNYLLAQDSAGENNSGASPFDYIDALSNGFKIRSNGISVNASGGSYIYMAFCENPFQISRAR